MSRVGLFTLLLLGVAAPGCGAPGRPYARDPLVRDGTAVRGDPTRTESRELAVVPVPVPPRPPAPSTLAEAEPDENSRRQFSIISPAP